MRRRGRPPGRRVDAEKLRRVLLELEVEPTFTGFMCVLARYADGDGRTPIGETAAKKFFNGEPVGVETQAQFLRVFGYPFDEIAVGDEVADLGGRLRRHFEIIDNSYYLDLPGMTAAAKRLPEMIADLRTARRRSDELDDRQRRDAALLSGEVSGALHTFELRLKVGVVREMNQIGSDLSGMAFAKYPDECLSAQGRIAHNFVGPGASAWRKLLEPLPPEAVAWSREWFRRSEYLHYAATGRKDDHNTLAQLLSSARVLIQSRAGELDAGESRLDEASAHLAAGGWASRSHARCIRSLLATKRGLNRDAVHHLELARDELSAHYLDDQHPHVAACDLRLYELDPKKVSLGRVRDARRAVLTSPLKFIGTVDMELVRAGRSSVALVREVGTRLLPDCGAGSEPI